MPYDTDKKFNIKVKKYKSYFIAGYYKLAIVNKHFRYLLAKSVRSKKKKKKKKIKYKPSLPDVSSLLKKHTSLLHIGPTLKIFHEAASV